MSFTISNGWDDDLGYFSVRARRGVGQRLHPMSRRFYQAMDRNPLFFIDIIDRPTGFMKLGHRYNWAPLKRKKFSIGNPV